LPGAAGEAASLVSLYPHARSLIGRAATRSAFLAGLSTADVVHFAGHAIENADNPDMSALVLAASPSDMSAGALRARDIASLRLPHTRLVVLAACETADGPVTRSEGVHSLARPFLDAGVSNVVATLWKIDDAVSADLFHRLHQYVAGGEGPVDALRHAQLDMIAGTGTAAQPRAWAGVIVSGATGR
jgi:CHAT domain-containing protein